MDLTYACLALGLTFNEIKTLHWALQRPDFYYTALNHMIALEWEQCSVPSDIRIPQHLRNQPAFLRRTNKNFLDSFIGKWIPIGRKTFCWLDKDETFVCAHHLEIGIPDGPGWRHISWSIYFPVTDPTMCGRGDYPCASQFFSSEALTTPTVVFQNVLQRLAE